MFGKGVFSTVLRAYDLGASAATQGSSIDEVAIKVIRNNESLRKAGLREIDFLRKIADHDKHNRKHCVRMLAQFDWRNHLCIVFEPLYMNLREVLKKFGTEQGKEIGINIEAVQLYTKQLCIALRHLKQCTLLHADIKPDNILINEKKNLIKLCDFGSASYAVENAITPYLVSRFYRAPEIILGLRYDYALDIWSVGCTLFELYTGKILFPGSTNNDMLRLIMDVKGKFPNRLLKKAAFRERHFDENFNFLHQELDKVSQQILRRKITITSPTKDMFSMLHDASVHEEDPTSRKRVVQFRDLLEKMLALDPAARLTPDQALQHPFLQALPTQ